MIDLNNIRNYSGRIAIIPHGAADFDAMVSGILLQDIFTQLGISSRFVLQDGKEDEFFVDKAAQMNFRYAVSPDRVREDDVLFLVDHTGAYKNPLIGCFDHHPEVAPVPCNYVNKAQTCCAKIIHDWAESLEGVIIPQKLMQLIVYACYMDSLSFKSDKALPEDRVWCQAQMKELGMDEQEAVLFGYGLTSLTLDPEVLFTTGIKSYPFGDNVIKASYACTGGSTEEDKQLSARAADFLRNKLNDKLIAWCYIVQNAVLDTTHVTLIRKDDVSYGFADRVLGRGKTIIPAVLKFLSE